MAVLYITEFAAVGRDYFGRDSSSPMQPPLAEQTVAISGTSTQSAELNPRTRIVRVHTDAICSIQIAESPTATTSKMRMAAGGTEYFAVGAVKVNETTGVVTMPKIAVISNT